MLKFISSIKVMSKLAKKKKNRLYFFKALDINQKFTAIQGMIIYLINDLRKNKEFCGCFNLPLSHPPPLKLHDSHYFILLMVLRKTPTCRDYIYLT